MRTSLHGLSADPSRDPDKFGKWKHRAQRLERLLDGGNLNGETEQVRHMLDETVARLRQLGGEIPSCMKARAPKRIDTSMHMNGNAWRRREADGTFAYYSYGRGERRQTEEAAADTVDADEIDVDAPREALVERRAEDIARSMLNMLNARGVRPESTDKPDDTDVHPSRENPAFYALEQLGWE